LTAFHASDRVSGTGPMADIISGEGTMVRLVRKTPGVVGRGVGGVVSGIPLSDVGLSTLGIKAGVDASGDWVERSRVDGRFLLQGRGMAGVDSLACRRRGGSSGSSELAEARGLPGLLPAPVGSGCAKLGWLNFLSKREKDICCSATGLDQGDSCLLLEGGCAMQLERHDCPGQTT